ncbi:DUF4136 domain-containing protein [Winogradskyella immobilis]|uniref:DUF4136 domain-containing protein n=1 Tax=Winogradskyella immobilis TaxID=2816852 RepID=A0ABS8ENX4_9FLAO|nr:DUF4136 domain-containing protein [Winogradskyella immobilis]MCC1484731.1 DUF4136 domain-containing protein [Winogradskyella immobilis]MCG0016823.1 DUF4136 domain-containing protein [Winogradskyella immobilis]
MKKNKFLKFSIILLLFSSCGVIVNYDYDKDTNFSEYTTYNYFSDIKSGLSEFDTRRLYRALDAKLESIGITKSDNPTFYIDIQSKVIESRSNSNVGIGLGGTGRNVGGGVSIGIPVGGNAHNREIVIEFVDDNNNEKVIWQAVSADTYGADSTPEKREAKFIALVEKIFKKYPPKK